MPILTERERIGTKLDEKYELHAILGSGGMGTVYVGAHAWTGRRVAVKILKPTFVESEEVVRRFLREARAAASLHHPNVVDVLDMGRTDDGAVYMVLELLEGDSLGTLLRRDGKMKPSTILPILVPIAEALSEVHERGFVHRDLKPDNIFVAMLRGRVVPKLLDFGIAKALHDPDSSTRTGAIIGTAYYMSPEQAAGRSDVGPQTDVWALGVVLYEALKGEPPFTADTATGVLVKILTTKPSPLPRDLPEVLVAVVERAMRHEAADRYADMRAMVAALREAARSLDITLPAPVAMEVRTPEEIERASLEPSDPRAAAARAATVPSNDPLAPSSLRTLPREAPVRQAEPVPAVPAAQPGASRAAFVIGALTTALILVLAYLAFVRPPPSAPEATPARPPSTPEPVDRGAPSRAPEPSTAAVGIDVPVPEPAPGTEPSPAATALTVEPQVTRTSVHRPVPTTMTTADRAEPPTTATVRAEPPTTTTTMDSQMGSPEEEPVQVRDEW